MYKTRQLRTTFGSWDVEKVHAAVVRSAFPSQKCKKTEGFGAILMEFLKFVQLVQFLDLVKLASYLVS